MARQGYYTNPAEKKLEVYKYFTRGMNSQSHPENLRDEECVLVQNLDYTVGGGLSRREGMTNLIAKGVSIPWYRVGYKKWRDM